VGEALSVERPQLFDGEVGAIESDVAMASVAEPELFCKVNM
jgi:hypothetical protein